MSDQTNNASYPAVFYKGYLSALNNTPIDNDKISYIGPRPHIYILQESRVWSPHGEHTPTQPTY